MAEKFEPWEISTDYWVVYDRFGQRLSGSHLEKDVAIANAEAALQMSWSRAITYGYYCKRCKS